jgi:DNA-binding CsgD family transcriptional regulator
MAGIGVLQPPLALVGRERELAAIDGALERALGGVAAALVVRGEPGIGKSALLEYATGTASEMTVLRATGVEAEADIAFAGLYGLVRPVLDKLDELPETQRGALAGALGLAPSAGADRLLVSAAVLSLLAAAADQSPVLCAIDDAQWFDQPSADALVFSARRLRAERLVMLFGVREGDARRFDATDLPELFVEGLDALSATAMLASRGSEPAPAVRERLLLEAAGNPLALLELPAALSAAQLAGEEPLPALIPLTPRLQSLFLRRIERLPWDTQEALLIAAADNTGDLATVTRAAAQTQLPRDALDAAETAGLIRISDGSVSFQHPLVRSALYEAATQGRRQRAHAALADVLSGEEYADRRVWHQAMATFDADEGVAAALEASARRSQARAAQSSAATAFLRAAELSRDENRRTPRIAAAAQAAWDAGQADRAREAVARALPLAGGELKAQLLQLSGAIEERSGSLPRALELLLEGADATSDPSLRLEMSAIAAEAAVHTGQLSTVVELAERLGSMQPTTARDRLIASLLRGFAKLFSGDHQQARALLAQTINEAEALDDPRALAWAAAAATVGGQLGDGLPYANRAVESARRHGILSQLPRALQQQGSELVNTSGFDLAYAVANEGYRLSLDIGQVGHTVGWHLLDMGTVEAVWGRQADARAHLEEALAIGARSGSTYLTGFAEWRLGLLELALGRPAEAAARLLTGTDLQRADVNPLVVLLAIPDAVEAAARCGRSAELGERLAAFEQWSATAPVDAQRAQLARCHAILGTRPADEAFTEAIDRGQALPPFERARTELLYGEWLRRGRRRQDARVHLRRALEIFRSLGTAPFAERAEAELRATGETARKRDPSTLDDLTPQELQIAGLVAQGLTNREIASQLFLSPRTIDYHLHKVFSKLGIASRTELIRNGTPTRHAP